MSAESEHPKLPTWRELHPDTAEWAENIQLEFFRTAPSWRKAEMLGQLNEAMRTLAQSGLEAQFPNAPPAEIRRRLADILLGPELALKVLGPITTINGIEIDTKSGN